MCRIERRRGEDRAVKKAQVFLKWVLDRELIHHCTFDSSPIIDDAIDVLRCEFEPHCLRADKCVERATIRHIELNGADSFNIHMLIA